MSFFKRFTTVGALFASFFSICCLNAAVAFADVSNSQSLVSTINTNPDRTYITDWYIKNFDAVFDVSKDSTMTVTENIVADCGDLVDKHGIFRVLPTVMFRDGKEVSTPIYLISITDFNGHPYHYEEINDLLNNTVTWKIGDKDIDVHGVNNYRIKYKYKNVVDITAQGNAKDRFYWNLTGNFWNLEIDNFSAKVVFPAGFSKDKASVNYFVGKLGSQSSKGVSLTWDSDSSFTLKYPYPLPNETGISVDMSVDKGIFTAYQFTFWELYEWVVGLLIFLIGLFGCIYIWWVYGREAKFKSSTMPEFTVPDKLDPVTLGFVMKVGFWSNKFIAAGIIALATKEILTIKEIPGGWFKSKDFEFNLDRNKMNELSKSLSAAESKILDMLFGADKDQVLLSKAARSFSREIYGLTKLVRDDAIDRGYFTKESLFWKNMMMVGFAVFGVLGFLFIYLTQFYLCMGSFSAAVVCLIFFFFMLKRSAKGSEVDWHANNLKMYMKTAEKDRLDFYEKENVFEKFLPYAVLFGITSLWIKRIKAIYGEQYYQNYHPAWYSGAALTSFSASSFESMVNSMSSSISSSMGSTSSGSGGGGGGGGGGGW